MWDVDVIRNLLLPCKAELVMRMLFSSLNCPDRAIWLGNLRFLEMSVEKEITSEGTSLSLECAYVKYICVELGMPIFLHEFVWPMDLLENGTNVCAQELLYMCIE
ncbi:hypothetical protein LIER_06439 [Lithospermum erythrorhizon]|uniref:Uncharacterized protein n=1 Tax=Lithospermum erythrorhizon TaxID=34254 RepID=A0AAV3P4J4_LITER